MKISLKYSGESFVADLSKAIDISIPVGQVKCFYAPDPKSEPFKAGDFIGSVSKGSPVNFYNLFLNPHGNGTHTEGLGHISLAHESINDQLKVHHFMAALVSVETTLVNNDQLVTLDNFKESCNWEIPEAIVIRTLPNLETKLTTDYSGTNPPYLEEALIRHLAEQGVEHLIVDLPSVDREEDGGKLLGHKAFWNLNDITKSADSNRAHCTITELVYIRNDIEDGLYLLNLQIPSISLDAVPSKPVLYKLIHQ